MPNLLPEEEQTIATYNRVAQTWASKHHQAGFWRKEMLEFRKLLPSGKILDIGSGGARDAHDLIALGFGYVGVDISVELLNIARRELPKQKFYKQSIYELKFPRGQKFDGFWCSAVLLHVPKARINEALQRVKTVVKPGAIGFISIKDGRGERTIKETWENGEVHKRFFSYWSKKEFSQTLKGNGYQVLNYLFRPDSKKTRWHCFFVRAD